MRLNTAARADALYVNWNHNEKEIMEFTVISFSLCRMETTGLEPMTSR